MLGLLQSVCPRLFNLVDKSKCSCAMVIRILIYIVVETGFEDIYVILFKYRKCFVKIKLFFSRILSSIINLN